MSLPVLHIWPGQWGLSSTDPTCLAAAFYLQLAIPGKFSISYCTNPDLSPSGMLPFLTHGHQVVSPLSSIIKYISGVKSDAFEAANMDAGLTSFQISQKTAWCSHVEANLGDLTAYMFYSLPENWAKLTHRTLAYSLPVPQRYYVPSRIRTTHRPRLEAAGLWNEQPIESKDLRSSKSSPDHKEKFAQTFQREKALQTARDTLDMYVRLLGENQFVHHGRLTTLDIMLAAHILVIIKPPFPETLFSDLLADSYPTLVAHAERILEGSLKAPAPTHNSPQSHSISSLFPPLAAQRDKSAEETEFELRSWGWISLAVGSVGLYWLTMGIPVM
ncbi:hypothetical protein B0H17DRAFT_970562 [Mycena rosella]|uniref:Mitochondrial outer membrane transport complex Sam37/metaxin N-terminal domain-containing protein n=1 Tax=Mycena rosella TaxID=1033263 RepID=A0AAD7H1Q5_MYCRO|nr:hypothetical protein B0H17DRAFT_970562 [Mycena rosella]